MKASLRLFGSLTTLLVTLSVCSCGGGGGSSSVAAAPSGNVQPISVNAGPTGQVPNLVLTSVTICVPGTSTCQTIPNVVVDTGSTGLRLLASAVTIGLPALEGSLSGHVYSECAGFADGVVWGPLRRADVKLAGEKASAVSMQLIQDQAGAPHIPGSCAAQGAPQDSLARLGANGILGVGLFLQDCGPTCAINITTMYYDCTTSPDACSEASLAVASQVSNPAAFFAQDNNGVILKLPAIANTGAASVSGSMIFGIGTQTNNALTANIISVPADGVNAGNFSAQYRGVSLPNSFFDSGSSGLFFDDSTITACPSGGTADGFYCPGSASALSAVSITATIAGIQGGPVSIGGTIGNAEFLFNQSGSATLNAFNDLAGPAGATLPDAFDFGVPFFFGRSVFTAFEQRSTPNGSGPYFAFQSSQ